MALHCYWAQGGRTSTQSVPQCHSRDTVACILRNQPVRPVHDPCRASCWRSFARTRARHGTRKSPGPLTLPPRIPEPPSGDGGPADPSRPPGRGAPEGSTRNARRYQSTAPARVPWENLAGRHPRQPPPRHGLLLVVVDDLDVVGVSIPPAETHAASIVDPNAVLPFAITGEPLQSVTGSIVSPRRERDQVRDSPAVPGPSTTDCRSLASPQATLGPTTTR